MGSFWAEAYNSFRSTGGFILTVVGGAIGVWTVLFPTPFQVDVRWVLLIFILAYIASVTFADLAKRALGSGYASPRVIVARRDGDVMLLLLAPSQAFGNNSVVSVYQRESEFEIFIGVGRVNTIQQDGRIQVLILDQSNREDLWERICKPEVALLSTLIVKPTIPFEQYQGQATA